MGVLGTPFPPVETPGDPSRRRSGLDVIIPPASPAITWAEAKAHVRIDGDAEQVYVESLVAAATSYAEEAMACSLVPRTYLATFYAREPLVLSRGPILEVLSIEDAAGVSAGQAYSIRHDGHRAELTFLVARAYPISVMYRAGYESIPPMVKLAIMQIAATSYLHRESVSDRNQVIVPHSADEFFRRLSRSVGVG